MQTLVRRRRDGRDGGDRRRRDTENAIHDSRPMAILRNRSESREIAWCNRWDDNVSLCRAHCFGWKFMIATHASRRDWISSWAAPVSRRIAASGIYSRRAPCVSRLQTARFKLLSIRADKSVSPPGEMISSRIGSPAIDSSLPPIAGPENSTLPSHERLLLAQQVKETESFFFFAWFFVRDAISPIYASSRARRKNDCVPRREATRSAHFAENKRHFLLGYTSRNSIRNFVVSSR